MTMVESLQKAINYMENNLTENISMENIAKEANMSLYHFQRTFSVLTDISAGDYLRRRRLTLAAQELSRTHHKVIDIAYKYGYETPESFSKAFRKQHGVSPKEARTFSGKLTSYNRLIIQVNLKGAEPMQYRIIEKEGFHIVGVKEKFSLENGENEEGITKMWKRANSDGTSENIIKFSNHMINGWLGVCVGEPEGKHMDYWIAVTSDEEVPEGFQTREIPAAKWAVFGVHGAMPHAIQSAWKQIFSEWFPSSGYEHAPSPELEVYGEGDPYSEDYYSEIWIPVK
ncbi:effector binding domain-containing protein [Halobacillus sp. Marseille-Q1614]|uniref:AraC family transcriptional regulator n=1 Tax=Halobacillus sp. Marseille-Q1614 TaxID=2709134 RepID=UPI00156F342B|nr:effector binding domain-containing protein [Halobacillus sp. Marseille-Q1614]